jgi:hypothetical protein
MPPLLFRPGEKADEGRRKVLLEVLHRDLKVEGEAPAHESPRLPEARVVGHERDDARGGELRGHEAEGLREDGGDDRHVRGGQ